jgi:large subunit ribosomal protein L31
MKKDIHPQNYRPVVFQDSNDGTTFISRSTVATQETTTMDGVEYPLVKLHISSSSHPFFTGQEKLVDIEGRVDKFKARQEAGKLARETKAVANKPKAKKAQKAAQKLGETKADKTAQE